MNPNFQYEFMGNPNESPFTPFEMNYRYDDPDRAYHFETKKCNESYPVNLFDFSLFVQN